MRNRKQGNNRNKKSKVISKGGKFTLGKGKAPNVITGYAQIDGPFLALFGEVSIFIDKLKKQARYRNISDCIRGVGLTTKQIHIYMYKGTPDSIAQKLVNMLEKEGLFFADKSYKWSRKIKNRHKWNNISYGAYSCTRRWGPLHEPYIKANPRTY